MNRTVKLLTISIAVLLGFCLIQTSLSWAVDIQDLRKLAETKKAELNNTKWAITVSPMSGPGKGEADIVEFADNKVISKNMASAGFPPADFNVRVLEDGTVVWDAMQQTEKGDIMLWRGDISGGVMSGVLSRRDSNGKVFDFKFTGTR